MEMLLPLLLLTGGGSMAFPTQDSVERDGDSSRKVLGSSVVTSVSVILDAGNGSQAYFADAAGKPVTKPAAGSQVASPINLLNPDRYEFYTFDDSGDLVKRLMTLDEIQGIIANGDGEFAYNPAEPLPEKKVDDIVTNVQNVLKGEMETHKPSAQKPVLDTPDVSSTWSMILPAIFGNSGEDIKPAKPNSVMTPDTIMLDFSTKSPGVHHDASPEEITLDQPQGEEDSNKVETTTQQLTQISKKPEQNNETEQPVVTDHKLAENQVSNATVNPQEETVTDIQKEHQNKTQLDNAGPLNSTNMNNAPIITVTVFSTEHSIGPILHTTETEHQQTHSPIITIKPIAYLDKKDDDSKEKTAENNTNLHVINKEQVSSNNTTYKEESLNNTKEGLTSSELSSNTIESTSSPGYENELNTVQENFTLTTPKSVEVNDSVDKSGLNNDNTDNTQRNNTKEELLTTILIENPLNNKIIQEEANATRAESTSEIPSSTTTNKDESNKNKEEEGAPNSIKSNETELNIIKEKSPSSAINEKEEAEESSSPKPSVNPSEDNGISLSELVVTEGINHVISSTTPSISYSEINEDAAKTEPTIIIKKNEANVSIADKSETLQLSSSQNVGTNLFASLEENQTEKIVTEGSIAEITTERNAEIANDTFEGNEKLEISEILNQLLLSTTNIYDINTELDYAASTQMPFTEKPASDSEDVSVTTENVIFSTEPFISQSTVGDHKIQNLEEKPIQVAEATVSSMHLDESVHIENEATAPLLLIGQEILSKKNERISQKNEEVAYKTNETDGILKEKSKDIIKLSDEKEFDINPMQDDDYINRLMTTTISASSELQELTTVKILEDKFTTIVSSSKEKDQTSSKTELEQEITTQPTNYNQNNASHVIEDVTVNAAKENIKPQNITTANDGDDKEYNYTEKPEINKDTLLLAEPQESATSNELTSSTINVESHTTFFEDTTEYSPQGTSFASDLNVEMNRYEEISLAPEKDTWEAAEEMNSTPQSVVAVDIEHKTTEIPEISTEQLLTTVSIPLSSSSRPNDFSLGITAQSTATTEATSSAIINEEKLPVTNNKNPTWTLVSTVAPHRDDAFFKPSESPAPHISVEPPKPVNLVNQPLQGFGLEESTFSLDADVNKFVELCNELAFGFWKSVTTGISSARSVFVSPFAATSLLAMVFLGARGSTSGEMNEILKLDDMVTFNPHLIFKNVSESVETSKGGGVAVSAIVRELYSDRSKGKLLNFYKERAKQFYDGYVEEASFKEIGDVVRRRTNLIVKRATLGSIQEYVKDTPISLRPPLAGVSASIFQTDCSAASTEGRDGELYFVVLPTIRQRRLIPVPAAVWKSGFLAGYDPSLDATAVSIGTNEQTISTIFVIPGQQGIAAPGDGLMRLEKHLVDSAFSSASWSRLLRTLIPRPGLEVQIPRFSHRSVINATSGLQRMGLKDLFSSEKADLRGLNGVANELYLSDILQINNFATCGENQIGDSHHSEIYPATARRPSRRSRKLGIEKTAYGDGEEPRDYQRAFHDPLHDPSYLSIPLPLRSRQARLPESPRLRLDRPFLYFVRHNPTGFILHMGRFNPRLLP